MEIRNPLFLTFITSTHCTWLSSSRTASGPNSLCKKQSKLRQTKERKILSLLLSPRSTVSYTEFSFLALSVLKMCKTKRLLSVHPFDFELDSDYSAQSRRQSVQLSPAASSPDAFQVLGGSWGVPFLSSSFLLSATAPSASAGAGSATGVSQSPIPITACDLVLCLRPSQEQDI